MRNHSIFPDDLRICGVLLSFRARSRKAASWSEAAFSVATNSLLRGWGLQGLFLLVRRSSVKAALRPALFSPYIPERHKKRPELSGRLVLADKTNCTGGVYRVSFSGLDGPRSGGSDSPLGCHSLPIRGTRRVAQALLAIPDAPSACIRHWRRQTSVPFSPYKPRRNIKNDRVFRSFGVG